MAQNFAAFEKRLRQNSDIKGTATCDYVPGYSMIEVGHWGRASVSG
ncbi:MAG: hypothetical protein F6K42_34805 [Leptolyngbya sp. SIO1D8]|nr:hypothetical protein [Leptolyngbya sp. SIO1D8]